MTKREHEALQEHFNKMGDYMTEADIAFKQLQDLNGKEGTGHRDLVDKMHEEATAGDYDNLIAVCDKYIDIANGGENE